MCGACGGKQYLVVRTQDRAVARVCECASKCRHCEGSGYIHSSVKETFSEKVGAREYETLAPCMCRLLRQRVERFSHAHIPGVLAHGSFESFRAFNEAQHAAKQVATKFAHSYRRNAPVKGF